MPYESHKLMKTVPVIRCSFCAFERAGKTGLEQVTKHEEGRHARQLWEKRLEELKKQPAPPPSTAPIEPAATSAGQELPSVPGIDMSAAPVEAPEPTPTTSSTPANEPEASASKSRSTARDGKASTKPSGAGTTKTA